MKKIHILCATRDAHAMDFLRRKLVDAEHCELHIAHDGAQALTCARRLAPDVLVVDAVLPGIDGAGLIDRMRAELGARMPRVIGGSVMGFASEALTRRGAERLVRVPWEGAELHSAITAVMESIRTRVDWESAKADHEAACALLQRLGMRQRLRGFDYLAWAAALACGREDRLYAIGERIYTPIALRASTTPQNVERLIRHAVESTMDAVGSQGVYGFFGNTIDPTRGKPTNGQMIGMLAQRLRVS